MKSIKNFIETNTKFLIFLITSVLLTSITMILLYENKYSDKSLITLQRMGTTINTVNSSFDNCISGSLIYPDTTLKTLKADLEALNSIKKTLSATVITNDKLSNIYYNLSTSIDSTINLYSYCLNSLSNSDFTTEGIDTINNLQDKCISDYKLLSNSGLKISFTESNILFLNNFSNYLNYIEQVNKSLSISTTQKEEFIKSLNTILSQFSYLLEDLEPAIKKVRADGRSFKVLVEDIISKEKEFSSIKLQISKFNIPDGCNSYLDSLNNIFDNYSEYLTTMKTTLIFEQSHKYKENKKSIDEGYKNAYSKLNTVKLDFNTLSKKLENL